MDTKKYRWMTGNKTNTNSQKWFTVSSLVSFTYAIRIFDVDVSSFVKKVFYGVYMTS